MHYSNIITFWSTDLSKEAILISDFLSRAVNFAISAALDLWSSDILEFALEVKCIKIYVKESITYSSSFSSAWDRRTSYLSSSFLYLVVRSSKEAFNTSSLDLNPAITSFVLSYFLWRSVNARSTAWRSSNIWFLSPKILSLSISVTTYNKIKCKLFRKLTF